MTSSEIRAKIRYNQKIIAQLIKQKQELELKLEECDALRTKYSDLLFRFESRQQTRRNKLSVIFNSTIQNNIINTYHTGMSNMLNGREFQGASSGVSNAIGIINKEIGRLLDELDVCENSLAYRYDRLDYWNAQLMQALAEGAEL